MTVPAEARAHRARRLAPRRARRRALAFVLPALLALTAAACGSSGPSVGALQGKSATAITSLSIQAYHRQKSVSFVTKTIVGKTTTIEAGATAREGDASETVTTNGSPVLDAVLVDDMAYVRASASVLEHAFNLSSSTATSYAGKWISLQKTDEGYQDVVDSLSPTQAIEGGVPEEPHLHVAGVTSLGGHTTVAVAGSPAAEIPAGSSATLTLFVSASAPYLPDSSTIVVKDARGNSTERVASVYGKYNEPVDPIAPRGATPIASLGG